MDSVIKQIYASIYIEDGLLEILVSEYFNTRFNVIRADKYPIEGINDFRIIDKNKVIQAIKKAIEETSEKIGAKILKVILVLPAFGFKRFPLRVSITPNGGILTKKDVARAITSSLNTNVDEDSLIVNASVVKYLINGIATRRLPEKEICDEAIIDIDLLCADKNMCFDYVECVSNAGVEVLDITLNSYSVCKESVLFEQSLNQNIILLDIENSHSFLTLLSKGKIAHSEIIYDGVDKMCSNIFDELNMPKESIPRLLKYNVDLNSKYPDDAVFAWNEDDNNKSITIKQLSDAALNAIQAYVDKILVMCKPIIDTNRTSFVVIGEGSKIETLINVLAEKTECEVKEYYPDTIGIRDSSFSSIFGSLFVYREKAILNNLNVLCLDMLEYEQAIEKKKNDVDGESITTRIKKLFEQYRDKEMNK